jgi:DNA helicase IV
MRERTLSIEVQAGDRVSSEYLAATLSRRAASLVDDPATTLFFGRTDHLEGQRWYIGRRHVADEDGDPVVIDWRAEVSRAFYRASEKNPMGLMRRRRFGVEQGRLSAYEDEQLASAPADSTPADRTPNAGDGRLHSAILAREIERPRVGPMRDIVATIQPEQDEIVRADVAATLCVQGAPGTGKTAVGLHRAAWLLYAHRDRLARSGVLVVGPNASFLDHVAAVLPSLGEVDVRHTTIEALIADATGVRPRGVEHAALAGLKGDARMAQVLRRAVWSNVTGPAEALVLPRGVRRWRVPADEADQIVEELKARGVRYGAARAMLSQRLAHAVLLQMEAAGDSPDDRVQDAVARSAPVRRFVDAVWPPLRPTSVLHRLLSDVDLLTGCAGGVLSDDEQAQLLWDNPPRGAGTARWTPADVVLLDEICDLIERTASLGHVVLDEAQDLSGMQLRAVGRRCSTGSATVLGDIAQGTTPWATASWEASLAHLGKPEAAVEVLDRGFRVPAAVIDWAAQLLPWMAPGLSAPTSVREDPGSLEVVPVAGDRAVPGALVAAARRWLQREGSIGLIVPDAWMDRVSRHLTGEGVPHADLSAEAGWEGEEPPPRVCLVPATVAKGLEFDYVVVAEPATMAEAEPDERTGLRRLYVVLTRAVSGLTVVHARELPEPLRSVPARAH